MNYKKALCSETEEWFTIYKKSKIVSIVFFVPSFNAEV